MTEEVIDHFARERAESAHAQIDGHEKLCAERYLNIHSRVGLILKLLAFGGSTLTAVVLALIGFLAVRALDANDANQQLLRMQLEQLQHAAMTAGTKPALSTP